MLGELVISEDPKATLLKYIEDHFDQIVPYTLHQSIIFQIRYGNEKMRQMWKRSYYLEICWKHIRIRAMPKMLSKVC